MDYELAPAGHRSGAWLVHPDGLLVVDGPGRVDMVDVNPATEQLFGRPRDWLLGRSATALVPESVFDPSPPRQSLFEARRADGEPFVALASVVPLATGDPGKLVVIRNVSGLLEQLNARERELEANRELLTQYLYGAGVALRSCIDDGTTAVSRGRLERALDVLDQVLNDLRPKP